jgi:hypothetical protein
MVEKEKQKGYWQNKDNVLAAACEFDSISGFVRAYGAAYASANKHGWLDEVRASLKPRTLMPSEYWTKERCLEDAQKYKVKKDWAAQSEVSYKIADRNGWLTESCKHMDDAVRKAEDWTLEICMESAKRFDTRTQWQKGHYQAYHFARINGWADECCAHMTRKQKPMRYWTKERCLEDAQKYQSVKEWRLSSPGAVGAAGKGGWLDECQAHMSRGCVPDGYWTKERVLAEARKYQTKKEWREGASASQGAAYGNGWMIEATAHMAEQSKAGAK